MACASYGSTSGVSIFYAVDADDAAAIGATITWNEVPFTSDSLAGNLTTAQSERITAARAYAGSAIVSGEVSGSLGFESEASPFMDAMLKAVLQSADAFASDGDTITNGETAGCFMFLKRVKNGAGYDYYIFRGVQIDSMSLSVSPGSLISGEIALQGVRMGAGALGATDGSNDTLTTIPVGWTLTPYTSGNIMSSVYDLRSFEIQDDTGSDIGVVAREITLTMSNQLRQQQGVGTGSPYAAGVASGRFMCTLDADAYYSGPTIIDALQNDSSLKASFGLVDATGNGWTFLADYLKVTDGPPPQADGPDQDLIASSSFQAFQSAAHGTIEIAKVVA